jgi:tubulin-specific chaperone A
MAPSQLQIATGVLQRLVKEEASYHKELASQQARIEKLEKAQAEGKAEAESDGNEEYQLRQEVRSPPLLI